MSLLPTPSSPHDLSITWQDQCFWLLPEKALFWPAQSALLLADLHLGKVAHFRKAGMALPLAAGQANFEVLSRLLGRFPHAERVIFLGDLFHSDHNADWENFCAWCHQFADRQLVLVRGNHDRLATRHYDQARLTVTDALRLDNLCLLHHPPAPHRLPAGTAALAGHVHPAVRLRGPGGDALQLPCFWFGTTHGLLPAFGDFTGTHVLRPQPRDQVFVIAEGRVLPTA